MMNICMQFLEVNVDHNILRNSRYYHTNFQLNYVKWLCTKEDEDDDDERGVVRRCFCGLDCCWREL